ncbi:hypothetical protein K469DRAFT_141793 [Zopfia rhizophila CBS 207.26]|uniref:Uncharacterized protein n=1 Tax=Zopfia rhizophila CBS 207.26 TaxID=1314779 RepID=A0A6A6E6F5_9PEZI|nr:hypothetical protein K469DRAFT_141793 [Zopfia rhizophila CBS 207.26]
MVMPSTSKPNTNSIHNPSRVTNQAGRDVNVQNQFIGTERVLYPNFFKTSPYEEYKNVSPPRVPGTCKWFLEHRTFQAWKTSNHDDILWLSADPGCGKSVLSRALIDEKLIDSGSAMICYFFFKDNEEQNNTSTAICALLHQLFCADEELLQRHAIAAEKRCGEMLKNEFEALWQLWITAATDPSAGDIICILDALDECSRSDRNRLIEKLESFYNAPLHQRRTESKLKFFVTSRPYDEIERRFRILTDNVPTIRLIGEEESQHISEEIGAVINVKVNDIGRELRLNDSIKSALRTRLLEIPHRTYLWLYLTLDALKIPQRRTKTNLLKVINELPRSVEEAYEKLLAKCNEKEDARKMLQIIVAAQRPLMLNQIDVALGIDEASDVGNSENPDRRPLSYESLELMGDENRKTHVRNCCGLFVSIVDSRIYLLHQTAKEFLIKPRDETASPQRWRPSIDLQQSHRILAEICVTHLLFREIQEYRTVSDDNDKKVKKFALNHTLLAYSANYWVTHIREARTVCPGWVSKTATLCDIGRGSSSFWFRVYSMSNRLPYANRLSKPPVKKQSKLYWSAVLGLKNETRFLLNTGANPNTQGGYYGNALQAAAYGGHEDIVKHLISSGADANVRGGQYKSALQAVCNQGHLAALEIFLYV